MILRFIELLAVEIYALTWNLCLILLKHITSLVGLTRCLIPVLKCLLSKDVPLGWQLVSHLQGRKHQGTESFTKPWQWKTYVEVFVLPLVLPVVQFFLQFLDSLGKGLLKCLSLCFPPRLSSPKTPNQFVSVQFADRVKLTEALLILLMSWLKTLKQQKT